MTLFGVAPTPHAQAQAPAGPSPDEIAKSVNQALDGALGLLTEQQRSEIAVAVNLPDDRKRLPSSAKRGMLVVFSACMFHARLGPHLGSEPKPDGTAEWPPPELGACVDGNREPVGALTVAWEQILRIDYRPIFETGKVVLDNVADTGGWQQAVAMVAAEAAKAAGQAEGMRHDLVGRVFHRVLDTAKFDGSFYTSTAAACLLAGLAIRDDDIPDDLAEMKIIDPACGTGTLLMAAAERIKERRRATNRTRPDDARALIENVLWGIDINVSACHLAATTLGLLSPTTLFTDMEIHRATLGPDPYGKPGEVCIGSLELLADGDRLPGVHWAGTSQADSGTRTHIPRNDFNLVIMNPPYTRDSLRHDQFPKSVEDKMKAKEKRLMSGRGAHGASGGTMFMVLGEHLSDLTSGTLAMVLPLVGATNSSGARARQMLGEQFQVEWVIASHDPERFWFSENTNIGEMLVVARRSDAEPHERPPTKFVNLAVNPDNPADAIALAAALVEDHRGAPSAQIVEWPSDLVAAGDWTPALFLHSVLAEAARGFSELRTPFTTLGEVCEIGPARQSVNQHYNYTILRQPADGPPQRNSERSA